MNTEYIQTNHVIQRYLHGKLTTTEAIEFEEYLLTHPEMVEEFELSALFKKALGQVRKTHQATTASRLLKRVFWPLGGILIGSAATWLMMGFPQPKHVASAVSPDMIYLGEMRGASTGTAPPVGAVLNANSQQQVMVLDVSMAQAILFDVSLTSAHGELIQTWSGLKKNAQNELVITTSLPTNKTRSVIVRVSETNQSDVLLSATIITGAD